MRRLFAILAASLALSSCATVSQRYDAADDVRALLVAIRDDDAGLFESRIDRPALERELGDRLTREFSSKITDERLRILSAIVGSGVGRVAGDILIRPSSFRRVAEMYGYRANQPLPSKTAISLALRRQSDGQVCAPVEKGGPCMLIFREDVEHHWRLVGFEGDLGMLNRLR